MRANKLIGDKQNQTTEEGGIAIQAGQNVTEVIVDQSRHSHYHDGVALSELIPLCTQIFDLNFPRLLAQAKDTARENAEKFAVDLKESIEQKLDKVILEKFADPDVQFLVNEAIQNVGRFGKHAHPNVLKNIIIERIGCYDNEEYLNILYSQAVLLVTKLTGDQIDFLTFIFFVREAPFIDIDVLKTSSSTNEYEDRILRKLESMSVSLIKILNLPERILSNRVMHLQSLGALVVSNMPWAYSAYKNLSINEYRERLINDSVISRTTDSYDSTFKQYVSNKNPIFSKFLYCYDSLFKGADYSLSSTAIIIVLMALDTKGVSLVDFGLDSYMQKI